MTKTEALHWIAEIFEEEAGEINESSMRDDIECWDSIGMLTLMAELDTEFDIQVDEDQLSELQSVGSVVELLRQHNVLVDAR
jgi:acyl carrier protein